MMRITLILAAAALSGCISTGTTIPSPVDVVGADNFQVRLHRTRGAGERAVSSGLLARPYADVEGAEGGSADGCTMTVLGKVPPGVGFDLTAGECKTWSDE